MWPWEWSLDMEVLTRLNTDGSEVVNQKQLLAGLVKFWNLRSIRLTNNRLRASLLLAAIACVLRPTNVLIWACLACFALVRLGSSERLVLVRETALCGYRAIQDP